MCQQLPHKRGGDLRLRFLEAAAIASLVHFHRALQQLRRLAEEHGYGWKHEGDPEVEVESTEFPMP